MPQKPFGNANSHWYHCLEVPHTGKAHRAVGIVDTGADECAMPAFVAKILGHNLSAGKTKQIKTGNGITNAYSHTTRLEIFHPTTDKLL